MAELEAERVAAAGTVEEAKKSSRAVKLLDSRVQLMMDRIKTEMEASEVSIGAAFHKLDLDGDGMLSKGELLKAMEEVRVRSECDLIAIWVRSPELIAICV
jgi:hypothetical protein